MRINVGAPKIRGIRAECSIEQAQKRLSAVSDFIQANEALDLVVLPEGTFDSNSMFVRFLKQDSFYEVEATIGGMGEVLEKAQQIARDSQTNIIFGSLTEELFVDDAVGYLTSAPVINNHGQIIHIRRKTTSHYCFSDICPDGRTRMLADAVISSVAMKTAVPLFLNDSSGNSFSVFLTICSELSRSYETILNKGWNKKTDLFVHIAWMGMDPSSKEWDFNKKEMRFYLGGVEVEGGIFVVDGLPDWQAEIFSGQSGNNNISNLVVDENGVSATVTLRNQS